MSVVEDSTFPFSQDLLRSHHSHNIDDDGMTSSHNSMLAKRIVVSMKIDFLFETDSQDKRINEELFDMSCQASVKSSL
jgi:hypothetical protein